MLKKLLAGAALVFATQTASAALVVSQSVVTGADMVGLDVTVEFNDTNGISPGVWQAIGTVLGSDPNPVIAQESLSGGVSNQFFTIQQQGNSLGNTDGNGNFFGLWSFLNTDALGSDVVRITLDGTNALIAFDAIFDGEVTPGSNIGRPYVSQTGVGTATYSNLVDVNFDDLYYTLTIDFNVGEVGVGDEIVFFADTDKLARVSAPATLLLAMFGFAALVRTRKA